MRWVFRTDFNDEIRQYKKWQRFRVKNLILQAWVSVFHDAWSEIPGDWMHFSAISMLGLEEEPKEELLVKGLKPGWSWCGPAVAWWECGGNDTVGMEMGSKADGPGKRSCGPGSLVKYWDTWPKVRSKNDTEFRKERRLKFLSLWYAVLIAISQNEFLNHSLSKLFRIKSV